MNDQRPAAGKPKRLKPRQVKVLTVLRQYQAEHGNMPTYQEVSWLTYIPLASMYRTVKELAKLGHLTLHPTGTIPAVLTLPIQAVTQTVKLPVADRFYREKVAG